MTQSLGAFAPLVNGKLVPRFNQFTLIALARCLLGNVRELEAQAACGLFLLPLLFRNLILGAALATLNADFSTLLFGSIRTFCAKPTHRSLELPLPFCEISLGAVFVALGADFSGIFLILVLAHDLTFQI